MFAAKHVPYLFVVPVLALILVFKIYPIFLGVWESLFGPAFGGTATMVGLENYVRLWNDRTFWNAVKVTAVFSLVVNPVQIVLAFAMATLLNHRVRGIGFFRSAYLVPVAVSLPIATILWGIMLHPEQGVVNSLLIAVGLPAQPFLTSSGQALWVIVLIATWKGVSYWMIFLLAGMQAISQALYEAAEVDGAGPVRRFTAITVPLMRRTVAFVLVADTVTNFLLFAPMYILTGGGPERSTNVLMLETYNSAFRFSDPGRASAIVVVLLVLIAGVVAMQLRLLRSRV